MVRVLYELVVMATELMVTTDGISDDVIEDDNEYWVFTCTGTKNTWPYWKGLGPFPKVLFGLI